MEIDTNSQIIQLVHSRPLLYSKCSDFRSRAGQWQEIADILKVDVTWVRSRWHLLRAKFLLEYSSELKGKPITFKYFNEMSFLVNHVNINAFEMHSKENEVVSPPEFVISKKDLEEGSDDDSSNVFIELELDEEANKELIQMHDTMDLTEDISENELDETLYIPNDEQHRHQANSRKYEVDPQAEMFQIVEVDEKEDTATVIIKENATKNDKQRGKLEACNEQQSRSQVPKPVPEGSGTREEHTVKPEKHRCEDSIFGELVTATLRKMPSEKKKAVKREIMNILFT